MTKEKAKKEQAFKKGASPQKGPSEITEKKEKSAGYKKEKSAVGALISRGFGRADVG